MLVAAVAGHPALVAQVPDQAATVRGLVLEYETGRPLEGAGITLVLLSDSATAREEGVSGNEGTFALTHLSPGLYALSAALPGYQELRDTLRLDPGSEIELTLPLSVSPVHLDPIVVAVGPQPSARQSVGFERRRSRLNGTFLSREDIERSGAYVFTDLLRSVGGVRVLRTEYHGHSVRLRGGCVPDLWLDGARLGATGDLDMYVRSEDVEAVEIYRGPQVPAEFSWSSCGAIIVWSRRGEPNAEGGSLERQLLLAGSFLLLVLFFWR
jgi:hypothetical protein